MPAPRRFPPPWRAEPMPRRPRTARRARALAGKADDGKPLTVTEALDRYQADLQTRGGDLGNATRARFHVPESLAGKSVRLLTASDLRRWRDALTKEMAPASVNRCMTILKAALNLAATTDETISNRQAWV
jgi:hypothetical protein